VARAVDGGPREASIQGGLVDTGRAEGLTGGSEVAEEPVGTALKLGGGR